LSARLAGFALCAYRPDHLRPKAVGCIGCVPELHAGVSHPRVLRVFCDGSDGATNMTQFGQVIHRDPDILGGTPVFVGTRVPVQSLFDYLEGGETLDQFLRQFPSVRREKALAALDLARDSLLAGARSS